MGLRVKGNFTHMLLLCPYCGNTRSKASHRTACYKVKISQKGIVTFRCVACGKTFKLETTGDYVLKKDTLQVI